MIDDTRGSTSPISYALSIAIATILITGLVVAAFGHVNDQRTRTTQEQMDVVGQQVAGSIEAADRVVRDDEDTSNLELEFERELPRQIQNTDYSVEILPTGSGSEVVVSAPHSDRDVRVPYHSDTNVGGSTVQSGSIQVVWDSSAGELEVQDA